MNIDAVNNSEKYLQQIQKAQHQRYEQSAAPLEDSSKQRGDRLEISDQVKNLQPIQAKLMTHAYDRPEVMREVATRISRLNPPEIKK